MKIFIILLVTTAALAAPGQYFQNHQFQKTASSYKNNELQHKEDETGYYSKHGDTESEAQPREQSHYLHQEYRKPESEYSQSAYGQPEGHFNKPYSHNYHQSHSWASQSNHGYIPWRRIRPTPKNIPGDLVEIEDGHDGFGRYESHGSGRNYWENTEGKTTPKPLPTPEPPTEKPKPFIDENKHFISTDHGREFHGQEAETKVDEFEQHEDDTQKVTHFDYDLGQEKIDIGDSHIATEANDSQKTTQIFNDFEEKDERGGGKYHEINIDVTEKATGVFDGQEDVSKYEFGGQEDGSVHLTQQTQKVFDDYDFGGQEKMDVTQIKEEGLTQQTKSVFEEYGTAEKEESHGYGVTHHFEQAQKVFGDNLYLSHHTGSTEENRKEFGEVEMGGHEKEMNKHTGYDKHEEDLTQQSQTGFGDQQEDRIQQSQSGFGYQQEDLTQQKSDFEYTGQEKYDGQSNFDYTGQEKHDFGYTGQEKHDGKSDFEYTGQEKQDGKSDFEYTGQEKHDGKSDFEYTGQEKQDGKSNFEYTGQEKQDGKSDFEYTGQEKHDGKYDFEYTGQEKQDGKSNFEYTGQEKQDGKSDFDYTGQEKQDGKSGFEYTAQEKNEGYGIESGKHENQQQTGIENDDYDRESVLQQPQKPFTGLEYTGQAQSSLGRGYQTNYGSGYGRQPNYGSGYNRQSNYGSGYAHQPIYGGVNYGVPKQANEDFLGKEIDGEMKAIEDVQQFADQLNQKDLEQKEAELVQQLETIAEEDLRKETAGEVVHQSVMRDDLGEVMSEIEQEVTTKKPGFWSRVGGSISRGYDKVKEKVKEIGKGLGKK